MRFRAHLLAIGACALWLLPGISQAQLSVTITPSRTGGAAPLAVFFDATPASCGTSSTCGSIFHKTLHTWDFDDPSSGNWGVTGNSKDTTVGPMAAHVFESSGSFTVQVSSVDSAGNTGFATQPINVTSATSQWAAGDTICFANTASYTGCPMGATQRIAASYNQPDCNSGDRRCLFRRGDTFTAGSLTISSAGPSMIGAFGSGALPKFVNTGTQDSIRFTSPSVADWRIADIEFQGPSLVNVGMFNATRRTDHMLFLRTKATPGTHHSGLGFGANSLNNNGDEEHTHVFVVEADWEDFGFGSGGNIIFSAVDGMAVLGSKLHDAIGGEHVIRFQHSERSLVSNSSLRDQASKKLLLTARTFDLGGSCSAGCGELARKLVIVQSLFGTRADGAVEYFAPNKSSQTQSPKGYDAYLYGNYFFSRAAGEGQYAAIVTDCQGGRQAILNNIVHMNNWNTYRGFEFQCSVTDLQAHNNTFYTPDSPSVTVHGVRVRSGGTAQASNNVLYAPNASSKAVVKLEGGATNSGSNNLQPSTQPFVPSGAFDSPGDFAPDTELIGQGTTIQNNPLDLYGFVRSVNYDVGAIENGGTPPVPGDPPPAPDTTDLAIQKLIARRVSDQGTIADPYAGEDLDLTDGISIEVVEDPGGSDPVGSICGVLTTPGGAMINLPPENFAPYAFYSDAEEGWTHFVQITQPLPYVLSVTPYTQQNCSGIAGAPLLNQTLVVVEPDMTPDPPGEPPAVETSIGGD